MKIIKRCKRVFPLFVLAMFFGLTPTVPVAAEFEDGVPLDLIKALLSNAIPGGEVKLSAGILEGFPSFTLPDDFEVLGSLDQGYSQRVALRTSLDEQAAIAAIQDALGAVGWQVMEVFNPGSMQGGFVSSASPPLIPAQLCHDRFGSLRLGVNEGETGRLVSLTHSNVQSLGSFDQGSCAEQAARIQQSLMLMGRSGVSQYAPRLVLPRPEGLPGGSSPIPMIMGGGGGGSNRDWESRAVLTATLSITQVYEHFAMQMSEQGWTQDEKAESSQLQSGLWLRTVAGDGEILALLSVLALQENNYDLRLRLIARNSNDTPGSNVQFNGQVIQRDPRVF
ncbi:MAG: hypothetical protein RQ899_02710 [Pseudomonadales bacterium]|nr:hypothetical protein [Pseudomonadales bacterium]